MMQQWAHFSEKFNAKPMREKLIYGGMGFVLIYALMDFIVIQPLFKERASLDLRLDVATKEISKLSTQEQLFAQALTNDPNAQKKREVEDLKSRLAQADKNLETLSTGLIASKKLPAALHDVLKSAGALQLTGMETLAPVRIQLNIATEQEVIDSEQAPLSVFEPPEEDEYRDVGVFKHSVVVALKGRYFDVVSYLAALEQLPWKIYWEGIDYKVDGFPEAEVKIEVYTLSTEQGVIGAS